jgi:cellulose synthase/poly-beta-1,6-N-acetylglucosamine synthase-like glycosyltransferase
MKYLLMIPAHNEAAFIEKTLDSTVAQTVLPGHWVIVDDTDQPWLCRLGYFWPNLSLDSTDAKPGLVPCGKASLLE